MRWQQLFADLEGQLEAASSAELAGEVADRSRRESGLLALADRLRPAVGMELGVHLPAGAVVRGRLLDTGPDWLLLDERQGAEVLVPYAALLGVTGTGSQAADAPGASAVERSLDLRWALRGLARSRAGVELSLVDGSRTSGTLDRVGVDHIDLAEHGRGEPRRSAAVRQIRLVPVTALAAVRST